MPKGYLKRNGAWVELKKMYVKKNGVWTNLATAYLKKNGVWAKIFTPAGPSLNSSPTITPRAGGKLYDTYDSTIGSWDNAVTYSRQWGRSDSSSGPFSDIAGQTSAAYVTRDADDGKYITVTVRATDANSLFAEAAAVPVQIVKYKPISLAAYTISGSPTVGGTLTAVEVLGVTWESTTDNSGDTYPDDFDYEWQWADTGGTAYNDNNSSTYSITTQDLGHTIAVRVTGTNTGGSTTSAYSAATAAVTDQYYFSFGKHLYVGSNGYIGLDAGGNTAGTMGAGRNISIYNIDLQQWYLAEYSDTSTYSLYFRSYLYNTIGSPAARNALDYQIKFYNDPAILYCDVYIVRKGADVGFAVKTPGYYSNGNSGNTGIQGPYVLITGSRMRIYFDGTIATTSAPAWTTISDNVWDLIRNDLPNGLDDSFTDVTTATNQSAPIPTNTVLPTLTTDTGNFTAGSTITINAGTWTNTNSYAYELLWGTSTPISSNGVNTKTLINTNQYVISDGDAVATSYYFRGRVTGYFNADQTGNSAIALTATSDRATFNATTTISVGTATSSGFTISGTAGPVNGFGTTRVNVSSIQIYNSSQTLISTITTGLPTVNGTTGAWSYIWSGGSSSTTYYAKVTVKATDSSETTFTTGFSASITTSAGVSTPTALSAAVVSGDIVLTFSGGSGDQYDIYYANDSARPTDGQAFVDFANKTSPFTTGLTGRGTKRWFYVRKSTGTLRSNWFPASGTEVTARIDLLTPPPPVITNSATARTSLSWHWTKPTPSSTQDDPTSWDYKLDESSSDPSTGLTNTTTQPTSGSPLVTGSLTASTTYYLHVRPKNADATGAWVTKSATTDAAAPVYAAVVWGTMTAPAFARNASPASSSTSYRWGWNNQLPSSGDYTASGITWEWQRSTANTTTDQRANPAGLIDSGTRPNRSAGGLTVGGSTYNNRVSSLSGDYNTTNNVAGANEPVGFSTSSRYLRYRAVVVGSDGTTYRSNYSAWV
jgi:hypothetical protein